MVCEECKACFNYLVCEVGCYGNKKPCKHLESDSPEFMEKLRNEEKDIE